MLLPRPHARTIKSEFLGWGWQQSQLRTTEKTNQFWSGEGGSIVKVMPARERLRGSQRGETGGGRSQILRRLVVLPEFILNAMKSY